MLCYGKGVIFKILISLTIRSLYKNGTCIGKKIRNLFYLVELVRIPCPFCFNTKPVGEHLGAECILYFSTLQAKK